MNTIKVKNIAELKTRKGTSESTVEVLGYYTEGDGGGGNFYWDNSSTDTDNGGTIISVSTVGTGRWKRVYDNEINVKWFGAMPNQSGSINNVTIQKAILASKSIYIPHGVYLINGDGITSDGYETCILLEDPSSYSNSVKGWNLRGDGDSSIIQINSDNCIGIRVSSNHNKLHSFSITSTSGKVNTIGLANVPRSMIQTTTLTNNSYNNVEKIKIENVSEAIILKAGAKVNTVDSGCWYNSFANIYIKDCLRGIRLMPANNLSGSPCNRNRFYNIYINGGSKGNTGVHIESGDTNKFISCSFEGIQNGTSPNTIPTAFIIENSGGTADNNSNCLFSTSFEANSLDIYNDNPTSSFYAIDSTNNKLDFNTLPLISIGGNDFSQVPFIVGGFIFQTDSQISGVENQQIVLKGAGGIKFPSTPILSNSVNTLDYYKEGVFTPSITSTGASNVGVTSTGFYTRIGNLVTFSLNIKLDSFTAFTGNYTRITGLPFTSSNIVNFKLPIVVSYENITGVSSGEFIVGLLENNKTEINLHLSNELGIIGGTGLNGSKLNIGTIFYISGSYYTTSI